VHYRAEHPRSGQMGYALFIPESFSRWDADGVAGWQQAGEECAESEERGGYEETTRGKGALHPVGEDGAEKAIKCKTDDDACGAPFAVHVDIFSGKATGVTRSIPSQRDTGTVSGTRKSYRPRACEFPKPVRSTSTACAGCTPAPGTDPRGDGGRSKRPDRHAGQRHQTDLRELARSYLAIQRHCQSRLRGFFLVANRLRLAERIGPHSKSSEAFQKPPRCHFPNSLILQYRMRAFYTLQKDLPLERAKEGFDDAFSGHYLHFPW